MVLLGVLKVSTVQWEAKLGCRVGCSWRPGRAATPSFFFWSRSPASDQHQSRLTGDEMAETSQYITAFVFDNGSYQIKVEPL